MEMKKILSVILMVTLICCSFTIMTHAKNVNVYTSEDGVKYYYLLDDNNNPYYYKNGEIIYLALPLEHLRVTDEVIISHLNSMLFQSDNELNGQRSVPTNYYDLSTGGTSTTSRKYTKNIVFGNNSYITTEILKYRASHSTIRVNTSNMVKTSLLASKKISFTYYYYSEYLDSWYYVYHSEVNCTSSTGFAISQILNTYQYGYFYFWNDGNLVSYDVNIWTTM